MRDKAAVVRREVECLVNEQVVNDTLPCEGGGKIPPSESECFNEDCKAVWTASKWTKVRVNTWANEV